jgi:hypothetical protein
MLVNIEDLRPGDIVVLDPTGRDMDECLEVGRVFSVKESEENTDVYVAVVTLNSGERIGNVEQVRARI